MIGLTTFLFLFGLVLFTLSVGYGWGKARGKVEGIEQALDWDDDSGVDR